MLIFDSNPIFLSLQLTNQTLSFSFSVEQDIQVDNLKPATVKAYDYYETGECDSRGVQHDSVGVRMCFERKKLTNLVKVHLN